MLTQYFTNLLKHHVGLTLKLPFNTFTGLITISNNYFILLCVIQIISTFA